MGILTNLPIGIITLVLFCAILSASRAGLHLGLAILLGAFALPLSGGAGLAGVGRQLLALVGADNLMLYMAMLAIGVFSDTLAGTGLMDRAVAALKAIVRSRRLLMAALPAVIGLLPMPGGALFSAPMVAAVDHEDAVSPAAKAALNYWFRHLWEYWWPLYPGVVLAMQISGLPVWRYLLVMIPLTLVATIAGTLFIVRRLPLDRESADVNKGEASLRSALLGFSPVLLVVFITILGTLPMERFLSFSAARANLAAMLLGLLVSTLLLGVYHPGALRRALPQLMNGKTWSLMLTVIGVQAFAAALSIPLDSAGSTAVLRIRDELLSAGIPVLPVMLAVPFVAGAVTGIAVGFVGASFPLVFALAGAGLSSGELAAVTVMAYAAGYVGMLASPIHICFAVSLDYFKAELVEVFQWILAPLAMLATGAAFITLLARLML